MLMGNGEWGRVRRRGSQRREREREREGEGKASNTKYGGMKE